MIDFRTVFGSDQNERCPLLGFISCGGYSFWRIRSWRNPKAQTLYQFSPERLFAASRCHKPGKNNAFTRDFSQIDKIVSGLVCRRRCSFERPKMLYFFLEQYIVLVCRANVSNVRLMV
jgi:hypothetical protein